MSAFTEDRVLGVPHVSGALPDGEAEIELRGVSKRFTARNRETLALTDIELGIRKKLRSKYDFDELKKDSVAKAYLDFNVGSWVIDGEDKLLTTDPEKWKATYAAAVKVKAAKPGVDVTKNVASGIVA